MTNLPANLAEKDQEIQESGIPVFYSEEIKITKTLPKEIVSQVSEVILDVKSVFGNGASLVYYGKEKPRGWRRERIAPEAVTEAKRHGRDASAARPTEPKVVGVRPSKKRIAKRDAKNTGTLFSNRPGYK